VEPMGSEMLVTIERDSSDRVVARTASDLAVAADQPVWIHLPPDRVLYFDSTDGRRLK